MSREKLNVELSPTLLQKLGGVQGVQRAIADAGDTSSEQVRVRPAGWSCCHDQEAVPVQFRPKMSGGWC